MNIRIVNETGCFMYFDNGNFVDSFFVNKYFFSQLTQCQLSVLKTYLEMEYMIPIKLFYDLTAGDLLLVCKNKKLFNKNEENIVFVFIVNQDGKQVAKEKEYDHIKHIENNSTFVELHDFTIS